MAKYTIDAIGWISSPFTQKFAVPRQPGLVTAAEATIILNPPYAQPDMLRGLSEFSHLWVSFLFHQNIAQGWQPLVRPPRLGGNEKLGVYATRSSFRPNHIGLSAVKIEAIEANADTCSIRVSGADWVHGTPVIDIKPYLPYSDQISGATGGFAAAAPTLLDTEFSATAVQQIQQLTAAFPTRYPQLTDLIRQVLAQDPRPAYHRQSAPEREYGMALWDLNIRWRVENQQNIVISVEQGFVEPQ